MKISKLLAASLLIVVLVIVGSLRQDLLHVPRIRVGSLHNEAPSRPQMRFFAVGDSGTGGVDQYKVAKAMNDRCEQQGGADAILLLGDNIYPAGVSSVQDTQWQEKIMLPYGGSCLGKLPIYAVLGNHDYKENPSAQIEFTLINPRWHMPNRFYSVDFGGLLKVVALDSNMSDLCLKPAFCSLDYLRAEVEQPTTVWTVVIAHHPIESSSDHGFNYRGGIRGMLLRPYLCNRADAYLSGHSHHLEHLKAAGCRLDMFVSGGGGATLYTTVEGIADSRFAKAQFGFLEIELSPERMVSRFIGTEGQVDYETVKTAAERTVATSNPKTPG